MARRKPYTAIGIKRLRCWRCGAQAHSQWQVCADGNVYRPLCRDCDVALNELVLRWIGAPGVEAKMQRYRETA